jgi:hypothetical protein
MPGGGVQSKSEEQPDAKQIAHAPQPEMRSTDEIEREKPCQSPAMKNGRCRMHGGKSRGAPKGNRNSLKHGRYTAEAISGRQQITQLLRSMKSLVRTPD